MGETLRSGCPIQARAHRAGAIFVTFRDGFGVIPSPNSIRNRPLPIDLCDCSERRLRGYTAMGYLRQVQTEIDRTADEYTTEYDEEALGAADGIAG